MHKNTLWDTVCASLRNEKEITSVTFSNWIEPLVALHYAHGVLILKAPNQFAIEVLQSRYKQKILQAVQEFDATALEVRFTLEATLSDNEPVNPTALLGDEKEEQSDTMPAAVLSHAPLRAHGHPLNAQFRFASFITGGENEFASHSAQVVAKNPGVARFNPLYIYGGIGSGKSHLLHAVGNALRETHPTLKVLLVSADEFYYGFSTALKKKQVAQFYKAYTQADVLLMDEVHRFSGREQCQLELFKIFNEFHQKGQQMVFTAHQPPEQLEGMQERLISRFQWGLAVGIMPPKLETRLAVLSGMAERQKLDMAPEVLSYIAEQGPANVRELEGVIIRLLAQSSLTGKDITLESAMKALESRMPQEQRKGCTAGEILRATAHYYGVGVDLVKGKGRGQEVAHCRQVGMYLTKHYTMLGLKAIGHEFGDRDHSTVVHGIKTVERKVAEQDSAVAQEITAILKSLKLS